MRTYDGLPGRSTVRDAAGSAASCKYLFLALFCDQRITGLVGTAISADRGDRWAMADSVGDNAVAFAGVEDAGWAVGDRGRIAKWVGRVDLSIPVRKP